DMPPASVQDSVPAAQIANYAIQNNRVLGVAEQPGRRIVFLALRDPVGPYVPRAITFTGLDDGRGHTLTSQSVPIEATVDHGGVVTGKALTADGTPLAGADVRLIYSAKGATCSPVLVS